jgi:hypothetical protein
MALNHGAGECNVNAFLLIKCIVVNVILSIVEVEN